jgi:hypothetical protein
MATALSFLKLLSAHAAFLWLCITSSQGQACQKVTFKNVQHQQELNQFIVDSERKDFLTHSTGIVTIYQRADKSGDLHWFLGVRTDDNYKYGDPIGWTEVKEKIVILLHLEPHESTKKKQVVTTAELKCLQKIVGNRVEELPTLTEFIESVAYDTTGKLIVDALGRPVIWTTEASTEGKGAKNRTHIIFYKDGQVSRSKIE